VVRARLGSRVRHGIEMNHPRVAGHPKDEHRPRKASDLGKARGANLEDMKKERFDVA